MAPLPNGPVSVLPDQSAVIWLAAVEGGGDVVDMVADVLGHDTDDVRADVEAFVAELVQRGLLRRE
ncbi:PqqD family protein [Janibacter sp. RAF20_2_2]|uniref:PqqD family protein n=1 Tax=unclassified Janibacter TaxID=2649294 RepID=UPI003F9121B4